MLNEQQKDFVQALTGLKVSLEERAARQEDRRKVFDLALSGLNEKTKEIRENFLGVRLVDSKGKKHEKAFSSKGQEGALDTFKATREGRGLSKDDHDQVLKSLSIIREAVQSVLNAQGRDGTPLFDSARDFEQALTDEIFTPMVRQGVLPENFVIDRYSEVQQLLNETFSSYRKRNGQDAEDAERKEAVQKGKRSGANGKGEQFGAVLSNIGKAPGKLADKMGLDAKKRRRFGIVVQGGKTLVSMALAGNKLKAWQLDPMSGKPMAEAKMVKLLDPSSTGQPGEDPDLLRVAFVHEKHVKAVTGVMDKMGLPDSVQEKVLDLLEKEKDRTLASVGTGLTGYGLAIKSIIKDLAIDGAALDKLNNTVDRVHHEAWNIKAALDAGRKIDDALANALDTHLRMGIGQAVRGQYAAALDAEAIAEAAGRTKPADQDIIHEFATAFEQVFTHGLDPLLAPQGKKLSQAFVKGVAGGALVKALQKRPDTAFDPVVVAAENALKETLGALQNAPGTDTEAAAQKLAVNLGVLTSAARVVAGQIDAALVAEIKEQVDASTAEAFAELYAGQLNLKAVADLAARQPFEDEDGKRIVDHFATAFHATMARAAPDPSDVSVIQVGKLIQDALKKQRDSLGQALAVELGKDVSSAFRPLLVEARKAIGEGMKSGGEGLKRAFSTPEAQRMLAAKSTFPDGGEQAMQELEATEEELRDYERQLVLIDEGGIAAAELNTIEVLIEKLEQDRAIAEMIISSASVFTSLGITSTTIVGQQLKSVTDTLVGEIVGPLKAAKLIVKFAVHMKAANERRILLQKFSQSLNLSKKAKSPLQSTIQGFFNNKVEQVAFRAIEDALILVQIASAILGSVPEPITQALGKTVGAVATAGENGRKLTEMLFNESMLSKGWATTLAAIRNPRDRVTGLAALKLNPTLGMHAIAWAGMEKQPADPIARNLLSSLGLNEQTLQVSGTETAVRKYLEVLLNEDRVLLDPNLISPKWVPKNQALTLESWVVTVHRATQLAEPTLRVVQESTIQAAFKLVDAQRLDDLAERAGQGGIDAADMDEELRKADALVDLLKAYQPMSSGGGLHEEMVNVAAGFLKLADDRSTAVYGIAATNARVRASTPGLVKPEMARLSDEIGKAMESVDKKTLLPPLVQKGRELVLQLQILSVVDENGEEMPLHAHPEIVAGHENLREKVQEAGEALESLNSN